MYDIYAMDMEFEQCAAEKEHISLIVPRAVMHYVVAGHGYINGQRISAGAAFVASANSYMDYYPDKEDPWSYIYIRLWGKDVQKAFEEMGFSQGTQVVPFEKMHGIRCLLGLYKATDAPKNQDSKQIIANGLVALHRKKTADPVLSVREKNVKRIKTYIDDYYYKNITATELSEVFHFSSKYIRNLFVLYYGLSPKQYLQKKRMQRAEELLVETDERIGKIALSVGYSDPLLFSKMFAKQYGMSPKKYRLENRKSE